MTRRSLWYRTWLCANENEKLLFDNTSAQCFESVYDMTEKSEFAEAVKNADGGNQNGK